MQATISQLVSDYEQGRLTRRQLVGHLTAAAVALAGAPLLGQANTEDGAPAASPTFAARSIDHVALRVTDVPRARDFYQQHLGLEVTSNCGANQCFLGCGPDFLALFRGSTPGLDHFSFAIDGYQPAQAVEKLEAAGLEAKRRGNRVYFDDPDGIELQVSPNR